MSPRKRMKRMKTKCEPTTSTTRISGRFGEVPPPRLSSALLGASVIIREEKEHEEGQRGCSRAAKEARKRPGETGRGGGLPGSLILSWQTYPARPAVRGSLSTSGMREGPSELGGSGPAGNSRNPSTETVRDIGTEEPPVDDGHEEGEEFRERNAVLPRGRPGVFGFITISALVLHKHLRGFYPIG